MWFFLPFLRGHNREDNFYGLLSAEKNRFMGICGAPEDNSLLYDRVKCGAPITCSETIPSAEMRCSGAELL